MLKRIAVFALALVLALAAPALALTQSEAQAIAGPGVEINIDHDVDPTYVNGMELDPGVYCVMWFMCFTVEKPTINLEIGKDVPEDIQRSVFYHELGHYQQWLKYGDQSNKRYAADPLWAEWDADENAVRMSIERGEQPYLVERQLMYLYKGDDGYVGDPHHGWLVYRMKHARDYENRIRGWTDLQGP